jgi:hypothetical protein
MVRLKETPFEDKRKKPLTVKGTKSIDKSISFNPVVNPSFKKGGVVHRGQGKVMKFKKTKTI